eukprot:TRINITY_DN12513_c0_g2_i1.p1 TRINITY_DN12513_c0_g2~~TRINITY_DN12513_c0_g2_i1.p1  ORF type:complete len:362 (+),score=118.34 TRINITY_DN12513_c0_g2_i1:144-1229(+)
MRRLSDRQTGNQTQGDGRLGQRPFERVANKFTVGRKLGAGSFGEIFAGVDTYTGEQVAIKFEPSHARHPQLLYEAGQYRKINAQGTKLGFPRVHWYGQEGDYNVMVLDLLGPSLEEVFNFCGRRMGLKTVIILADQILARIESLHKMGLLHRDIKPDNFLMGRGDRGHVVFAIDLGLSKKYRQERAPYKHIPFRDGKNLTGTARYTSVNTHKGQEQSRRDDLEAIGYVLLYFLRGGLPWQNLKGGTKKEKYDLISARKQTTSISTLCRDADGNPLPEEFAKYLTYSRELEFEEEPDYAKLRGWLRALYARHPACGGAAPEVGPDYNYDWTLQRRRVSRELKERGAHPEDQDPAKLPKSPTQ